MGARGVAMTARVPAQTREWKPKLGVLGPLAEANVKFAHQEGFTNMVLGADPESPVHLGNLKLFEIIGVAEFLE
jgi:hypothetical protein